MTTDDRPPTQYEIPGTAPAGKPPAPSKKQRLRKILKWSIIGGIWVMVGLQFIPVDGVGVNPPERHELDAPPEVVAILKRACFDCHSNETRWPFYARLAPGSWLMVYDVKKGRNILNFSEWGDQDADSIDYDKEESWEQIESGNMPLWYYTFPMHLDARLSDEDKALLKAWMLTPSKPDEEEAEDGDGPDETEAADEKPADDKPAEPADDKPAEPADDKPAE